MTQSSIELHSISEAIEAIKKGEVIIVVDDADRENEGDFVAAAETITPEMINFMATHGRGLICTPLTEERCKELQLGKMVSNNTDPMETAFTVSVALKGNGVTTGISASDRALTVKALVEANTKPHELSRPGNFFPLIAKSGGVLRRTGHTEAAIDFARLAGFNPAGVIVEIMNEDGTMARRPELEKFAEEHDLKIGTIADLIHYRVINERTIEKVSEGKVNTDHGEFTLHTYKDLLAGDIHHALVKGTINKDEATLVRVHLASSIRDLLGTQPGDSPSWNIQRCIKKVVEEGSGVIVLLAHDEHPEETLASVDIAMGKKPAPVAVADGSSNAYLTIGLGSQIVRDVGVSKLRLMGPPIKYNAISGFDLEIVDFILPE